MTKKFDNFLLGLLWLMTITLAATFWMNIKYGFNIFSAAHWAYLSELQAYRTQIKLDFYISLIGAIVIGLTGLYLIMRGRRKTFFIEPTQIPPAPNASASNIVLPQPERAPVPITPTPNNVPTSRRPTPPRPISPSGMRTNLPPAQQQTNQQNIIPAPRPRNDAPAPRIAPQHMEEIKSIFQNAGYTPKKCARIGKLVEPMIALAYNNTVWIATSGVPVSDAMDAIQTLVTVFDDTLGDTANDMSVHACILNAPDEQTNNDLISVFKTLDEMREFMNAHPNTKPEDYDDDLFDAISTYIDTVANYIGKQ